MSNIAKSACTVCHTIKPRTEMTQITQRVASGQSIGMHTKRKGFSARQYYSNKKVWVCNECNSQRKSNAAVSLIFWCAVLFGVAYFFL